MKFSFIFATFALPLVANAASPPPSSSEGTTNEDFNSKANNADWTTGHKQVIADIAQHGFDDALEGLQQMFCLAVPNVMPNGKIRMEYILTQTIMPSPVCSPAKLPVIQSTSFS